MKSSSLRALGRRQFAVLAAAVLALAGVALVRGTRADAHEATTQYTMKCGLLGTVAATITTDHTTPVTSGGDVTLTVKSVLPPVSMSLPVNKVTMTVPSPPQVASVVGTKLTGGNLTGSATQSGSNLVFNFTPNAGVTSSTIQLPTLDITVKLKSGIEGQTINWQGPSQLTITAVLGVPVTETCNTVPENQAIAVTPVAGGGGGVTTTTMDMDHGDHDHGGPTTTKASTTTKQSTTTTMDMNHGNPSTTTKASTTTKQSTTTTMDMNHGNPSTTVTTGPTTRPTTRPTVTRPPTMNPFLRFIFCILFRRC